MENDRFIRLTEVEDMVGFKSSQLYQMVKEGLFPRPIKFGVATRWSQQDVQNWMKQQRGAA